MKLFPRYLFLTAMSAAFVIAAIGCKNNQNPANTDTSATTQDQSQDPAEANIAPISNASTTESGAPESGSAAAPAPQSDQYADQSGPSGDYDSYDQPVDYAPQAPPPLPEYDQPPCPGDDYIWTPGYWNYSDGYYWVPGAWVSAPYQGALWTPGFWGFTGGRYGWHRGYWGRHIGYYGGINYGFGYVGSGYQGGYWQGDHFDYNRTVNNVNTTVVHNVYNYRIVNNNVTRVSYNGPGGVSARPRPAEIVAVREQHTPPMTAQVQQAQSARSDRGNFAAVNHGRPQVVAVSKPLPADHNIRPPAPVPMRQPASNAGRPAEPAVQPRENHPAPNAPAPSERAQPAPRQQEPVSPQEHPAPVQHPERQQPAPERQAPVQHAQPAPQHQAPAQHAQPAPERQAPTPQRPVQQQRPAPVEHPQHQQPAPEQHPAPQRPAEQHPAAPQQHAAPAAHPAPERKPANPKKPDEQRPQ